MKTDEILSWLKSHRDVTEWVVLDALDLHNLQAEKFCPGLISVYQAAEQSKKLRFRREAYD